MKKILFLLILGVAIGYFVKSSNFTLPFLPTSKKQVSSQQVKGANTSARTDFSVIEKAVTSLSFSDIATSSPKIQTLVHLLQKLPKDQAAIICENACKSIQ